MLQQKDQKQGGSQKVSGKPLLRGWFHAGAAVAAIIVTCLFIVKSIHDIPRLISLCVFGLSMIEMYVVSAVYHILYWAPERRRVWRALDHANIFVMIAGTYTPLCFNILSGWIRIALLVAIWSLAIIGISYTLFPYAFRVPRWFNALLYVVMGWVAIFAIPAFLTVLPWTFVMVLVSGGVLYTIGAVVYARKWPDPIPRIIGYHEIFHLFVIAGSIAFTISIWVWALPFPRS